MVDQPHNYNKFFNQNVCHICKMPDNGKFITCDKCYMISYCKNEHRVQNRPYHVQICAAMQKLLKSHSELWVTVQLNLEQWIQSRKKFIHLIKHELARDLQEYEEQMITLTKSCLICHQQVNILPCTSCWSVNYCLDHEEAFKNYHGPKCKELEACFNIDLRTQYISPISWTLSIKNGDVFDMKTFVEHVRRKRCKERNYMETIAEYFYSDYVSGPVTLYYGMKNADLSNPVKEMNLPYVVHILATSRMDRKYLQAWELLLHLLWHVKDLRIILIGLELHDNYESIKICGNCKAHKQRFDFECHQKLYHNYVDSDSYIRPNVVISCQANLSDWDELSETILKLRDQNCPLLLTAKSKLISEQNINNIEKILGSPVTLLHHDINKFASNKPYRDFENDGVSYRNQYLAVCPKL